MTWSPTPASAQPQGDATSRMSQQRTLVIIGGVFLAIIVIGAMIAVLGEPPAPAPPCPVGETECGGPPQPLPSGDASLPPVASLPLPGPSSTAPRLELGTEWVSSELGFRILYDDTWRVSNSSGTHVALEEARAGGGTYGVIIEGVRAETFTPQQLVEAELALQRKSAPDLVLVTDTYHAIRNPSIGFVDAPSEGVTYKGHLTRTDGTPGAPVAFSIAAATDGRLTVVVAAWTIEPDRVTGDPRFLRDMGTRRAVDNILKDFQWTVGT